MQNENLRTYVQDLLHGSGLSLAQLAQLTGLDKGWLCRAMKGTGSVNMSAQTLAKLVAVGLDPAVAIEHAAADSDEKENGK